MDTNAIVEMLNKNNIPCNPTYNGYNGYDVSCNYNLKSYRITFDGFNYKLLETNIAANPRHKNRHHTVDQFGSAEEIVNYIINRKFFTRVN